MNNDTALGNPIPTAVLTPTEIITPADTAVSERQQKAAQAVSNEEAAEIPSNLFIEMMLAPLAFWTSVSQSYLRMFDLAEDNRIALQRSH